MVCGSKLKTVYENVINYFHKFDQTVSLVFMSISLVDPKQSLKW